MRVLIVEDNLCFGRLIANHLVGAGFAVDLADSVQEFGDYDQLRRYDLYLIDLNLPDGDGIELIQTLRKKNCVAPMLIMTARSRVEERVAGLDAGGDDYLVKPFSNVELLARIRAVLRRPAEILPNVVASGDLTLDTVSGQATWRSTPIKLRPSEQRLLQLLVRQAGQTVSRSAIENVLPGFDSDRSANAIDKLISRLRKALSVAGAEVELRTVKGIGYVIKELP